MKETPLTKDGLTKLEEELDLLRTVRRPEAARRIQEAKDLASTQNNPEYEEAKNEQAFVEGRILTLEQLIQTAILIDEEEAHRATHVQLGSTVTVIDQKGEREQFNIVGSMEANPKEGRISNESPVGRALLGKSVGDEVVVKVPAGDLHLKIVNIG